MAKEQGLSLNPTNISGVCGRLMCCLKNEEDVYEFLNARLPSVGDTVTTPDGLRGEVSSISVLSQKVKVVVSLEKELREYKVSELKFKPRKRPSGDKKKPEQKGNRAQNAQGSASGGKKEGRSGRGEHAASGGHERAHGPKGGDPQKKAAQPDVVEIVEQVEKLGVDIVQGQDA